MSVTVVASLKGQRTRVHRLLYEADAVDRAVSAAVVDTPTPGLDPIVQRLARASDYKALWLGSSALVAVVDGPRGRLAAVRCLVTIAVTSLIADAVAKVAFPRQRPPAEDVPQDRLARRPSSSSFPSGHTASAFAFATAFGREYPLLGLPISALAAAVGYSRIHTGVHYPSDVIAGAVIGSSTATLIAPVLRASFWGRRTRDRAFRG